MRGASLISRAPAAVSAAFVKSCKRFTGAGDGQSSWVKDTLVESDFWF